MKNFVLFVPLVVLQLTNTLNYQQDAANTFLKHYNNDLGALYFQNVKVSFTRLSNLTEYNTVIAERFQMRYMGALNEYQNNASKINLENVTNDTKRQFKLLLFSKSSKNRSINQNLEKLKNQLTNNYFSATIPNDPEVMKTIKEPKEMKQLGIRQLESLFEESNDPEELLHVWKSWRNVVGERNKGLYLKYVRLNNIGAVENGFEDAGEFKRQSYEVDNLQEIVEQFWNELRPFYEEMHAYVRHRLSKVYPEQVNLREPLPAHLLGNMWAQDWSNIFRHVKPYPDEPTLSVNPMLKEKYNVTSMYKVAEDFFVSLGWPKLPDIFWKESILEDAKDRTVSCHPSAWSLGPSPNGEKDVRILMCTQVTSDDFKTVHHELGHIYYHLFYWGLPLEYQTGANPGFHEAVGDTLTLSVQTPKHLQQIGLLNNVSNSKAADINFQMKMAIDSIAFLPFGYLMDRWVWDVYSGKIKPEEYNKAWWEMRLKYQGIKPPVARNETNFDPAAKFHISADVPYIRYFFATILKYTFYKHACKEAGKTEPLYKCSIYKSQKAGDLIKKMLKLGKSKPWPEALEVLTGSKKLTAEATNEYFAPLITWLREERKRENYPIGWNFKEEDNDEEAIKRNCADALIFSLWLIWSFSALTLIFNELRH